MGKARLEETFPCGYKIVLEMSALLGTPRFTNDHNGCPLHGSKCVKSGGSE